MAKISLSQFRALFRVYRGLPNQDEGVDALYELVSDTTFDKDSAWLQTYLEANSGEPLDADIWDVPMFSASHVASVMGLNETNIQTTINVDLPRCARIFGLNPTQQAVVIEFARRYGEDLKSHLPIGTNSSDDLEEFTSYLFMTKESTQNSNYTLTQTKANFPLTATAFALSNAAHGNFLQSAHTVQTTEDMEYCLHLIDFVSAEERYDLAYDIMKNVSSLVNNAQY
jgi:hypothetical protein